MSKTIEDETRAQIAAFLPDAIAKALTSYHRFSGNEASSDSNDPKIFSAHHSACKVAIAHIELLIKLVQWAGLPDAQAGDHNSQILLGALVQEAQDELRAYRAQRAEGEGEDE